MRPFPEWRNLRSLFHTFCSIYFTLLQIKKNTFGPQANRLRYSNCSRVYYCLALIFRRDGYARF
ncbi:MAG: hypothetical protein Fur0021_05740 [Candidatus Promineifilaceae bacterium]